MKLFVSDMCQGYREQIKLLCKIGSFFMVTFMKYYLDSPLVHVI